MSQRTHDDVLDRLKSKEDEMEARIQEARTRASAIKDEAARKAREIRTERARALDAEVDAISAERRREIDAEVAAVDARAEQDAAELRKKGLERIDPVVAEAVRFITEGGSDQGDEKDSDNRSEG